MAARPEARVLVPTQFLFVLAVPRKFVVPNTQQWNLTVQRDLGKQWVLEVGYVGTHAVHLRETRTSIQAAASPRPTNPVSLPAEWMARSISDSRTKHFCQWPGALPDPGINGYGGFQLFANDAYSHYNSLQTTLSRRWAAGYFQAAYTFSQIDGRNFQRQYRAQYRVQRRIRL